MRDLSLYKVGAGLFFQELMNFFLIQPPIEDFYTTPIRLYPLGLLYVAAVLQEYGHDVEILDCLNPPKKRQLSIPQDFSFLSDYIAKNPLLFKHYYRFGISDDEIINRAKKAQPDFIGISSQFTAYFSSVAKLATLLKNNLDIPIVLGGNHATAFPKEIKQKCSAIDFVLTGPAEQSVARFLSEQSAHKIPEKFIDWKYLQPAHGLLLSTDYRIGKKPYISLTATRGCPFRCEFCSVHNMFGRQHSVRDVRHILQEMRDNYIHKNVRIFNFEDDNLSFNRRWFVSLLRAIIDDPVLSGIELTAMNGLCYTTLDDDLLTLMRTAGFRQLNLSFVTQDESLRAFLKRPHKNNVETIVSNAKALGFFITVYVIIGLQHQTYDEIKKSIDYLLDLDVLVGPSVFYMPPASEIYEKLDVTQDMKTNWNLFRSSAFVVETEKLNRSQLVELFVYVREQNLKKKTEDKT